jgi:flagellar biosynthesis/type III secretory pathway M-ring protein FliF/YscJ
VAWQVAVLILIIVSLFLPSFRSLLIQFTIFPLVQRLIIDPYYKEHPEADKQLRRDLNLDVEETEAEKEEAVFDDARPVEKENPTFPRQYSAEEMNRIRRISEEDEDTTI